MIRSPLRKGLVAVAAVLSMVLAIAGPASADPEITSGTLRIGDPTVFEFQLGGDPENPAPCVPTLNDPVGPFDIEFNGDDQSGTWQAYGGFAGAFQLFPGPLNPWYKAVFDFGALSGAYWWHNPPPPGHWDISGGGTIYIDIYEINFTDDPEDPCVKKSEWPICTIVVDVVIVPHSYYDGTNPPPAAPAAGDTVVINAQSVPPHIQSNHCPFPFNLLHGLPAFIDNMLITF